MEKVEKKQDSVQTATLVVAIITSFVSPFAITSINIAVPHIGREFHASATSLTWVVLSFLIVTVLLAIPFGRIADIYGRKPILKTGILLLCISTYLNVLSPNMMVFLLLRVLQGAGAAMVFATNVAILVDAFPANRRGSVLGISVAAVYTGSTMGPVLGGLITHTFGWRGVFAAIATLALIAFITAMIRSPKEAKREANEKLNASSVVLYILSFGLLMYGLVTLTQNLWSYISLAAGIVLVVIFVRHEARTEVPVLEVRLFKGNKFFAMSTLAAIFNYAAVFAVAYLLSIYLQLARGLGADVSGLILISQLVMQVILSPIAGRLSDRKSPAVIASIGMACCATALFLFSFLNESTPIPYVLTGLLLVGVGIGFFASSNSTAIMSSVSSKDFSIAASVMNTARTAGQVGGMAILTIIINAIIGNVPIASVAPAAIVQSIQTSFAIFSAICVIGIFISLKRRKSH